MHLTKIEGQIEAIWPLIEPSRFYGNEGSAKLVKIPPIKALFAQMVESTFHRGINDARITSWIRELGFLQQTVITQIFAKLLST